MNCNLIVLIDNRYTGTHVKFITTYVCQSYGKCVSVQ